MALFYTIVHAQGIMKDVELEDDKHQIQDDGCLPADGAGDAGLAIKSYTTDEISRLLQLKNSESGATMNNRMYRDLRHE